MDPFDTHRLPGLDPSPRSAVAPRSAADAVESAAMRLGATL